MRTKLCFFMTCLIVGLGFGADRTYGQPSWFEAPEKDFPLNRYLIGVGVGTSANEQERMQLTEENARSNLIKSIRTQISSEFVDKTTETSQKVDVYTQSRVVSNAALEVDGIGIVRREKGKHTAYAIAALDKGEGRQRHAAKLVRLNQEIEGGVSEARRHEETGRMEQALKAYLRLYPLMNSREECQVILLALEDFASTAFRELDQLEKKAEWTRTDVDAAVERLTEGNFGTLDDAVAALAFRLGRQLDADQRVLVLPFTYGETRFHSPFSRYLAQALSHALVDAALQPVEAARGFNPKGADHRREQAQQAGADLVIGGSYLDKGDRLKIFALVSQVQTGKKVAAADLELAQSLIRDEQLAILPQNYQQALEDAGVFGKDELISGSLQVEIWTDRGSEQVVLEENEEITLGVRANQPCYLRVIYHLSNGMRVLLYNNYYIREAMANHAVALPDTFVVTDPFGVEVLQVMAGTEKFPEVKTKDWEGYPVLVEDLKAFVSNTRGLKKKQKRQEMAEDRVAITTMKKR
ncbi:MAG: LPP20 family lipoprotein [Candidatus Latescibacterota bacterium]